MSVKCYKTADGYEDILFIGSAQPHMHYQCVITVLLPWILQVYTRTSSGEPYGPLVPQEMKKHLFERFDKVSEPAAH